ncbi:MAG: class I SAM-dependent methyltransferase [Planctomyces sp.]
MRNSESWKPSKFVIKNGRLAGSRDPGELSVGSRLISDLTAELYQENFPIHCCGRLVDLGCGKVPLYEAYRDHVDSVTCVDWPGSLHGSQHIDVAHDLNKPLPFGSEEFDTILLSDVLEHIAEPHRLCAEMARILRPGGKCLLNTPFFYWLHEVPFDFYRYTEFGLRNLLEKAGFRILLLKPTGGSLEIFADLLSKHFLRFPLIGSLAASWIQQCASMLRRIPAIRRFSHNSAARFPLSYFVIAEKRDPVEITSTVSE